MNPAELIRAVPTKLWIGGTSVDAENGATSPCTTPRPGDVLTEVADASPGDAVKALDAAAAAQADWAATPARERGELLRSVFDKITTRAETFAQLMTLEMGKALPESRPRSSTAPSSSGGSPRKRSGWRVATRPRPPATAAILVSKQPVGPCLAITPWNFPLAMGTRKIGPALAAGCTMIVKPASETPLTMLALAELFVEAGLPPGVLSVLPTSHSSAVTEPLLEDPRLRKLTFTGSTGVGRMLVEKSAKGLLRTSMELGGNAPFVVFDDADVDAAVDGAMLAKLRNGGEACTAANRFHVANAVREEFTAKLTERMAASKMGPGIDPETTLGPLINRDQLATVAELVDDAVQAGAKVLLGGEAPGGPGWFYPATVLADVPASARILREEVFGPVAAITGFDTEEEAVAAATTPSSVSRRTSTPATWTGRCASPTPWKRAWSVSTAASSPTPRPRSAASRPPGSAARAVARGSPSTSRPSTSRSPEPAAARARETPGPNGPGVSRARAVRW